MIWDSFIYFAIAAVLLWLAGAVCAWKNSPKLAISSTFFGFLVFLVYVILMWVSLERPPLRTMGETRLWYSLFLSLAGLVVYLRRHYRWILFFTTLMATVFIAINLLKPEIHSKALMPALQSPWFAPHVIVYMMAYAMLGAAAAMAVWFLLPRRHKGCGEQDKNIAPNASTSMNLDGVDQLVSAGLVFMTVGMLFGALWAKEAWGHYWSWDPKETWAAATWMAYLVYLHYRLRPTSDSRWALWMLIANFALLQMCWWGVGLLPSAQGVSVHTYS